MRFMARDEFAQRAHHGTIVPIFREMIADELTPVSVYRALSEGETHSFLLESVEHGERWSRYSFIGVNPLGVLSCLDSRILFSSSDPHLSDVIELGGSGKFLDQLESLISQLACDPHIELPLLQSGFVGYLGYDIIREVEKIGDVPFDPVGFPDAELVLIGDLACFDHLAQRIYLISNVVIPRRANAIELEVIYENACGRLEELEKKIYQVEAAPLMVPISSKEIELENLEVSVTSSDFCRAIEVAKEHILEGDIFQVVLSKRFSFDLNCDAFTFYRVLRLKNPSPYMYLVDFPEIKIAGSSPEPLVRVEGRKVISRPIAGTRPRGETLEEDKLMAAELVEHPKELAEHIMLVDLARNDLGRVSEYGSEVIDELMTLERYSRVMHLTSQVSARLRQGISTIDVLKATMPAGTVSGAPKVRAMEIINELEPLKRGPYAGVVGYFDLAGNMDVAIALRTLFIQPGLQAHLQAGAGIVYDSDPLAEDEECNNKARALLEAATIAGQIGTYMPYSRIPGTVV